MRCEMASRCAAISAALRRCPEGLVHENRDAVDDLDHAAAGAVVQRIASAASVIRSSSVRFCIGNNPAGFVPIVKYRTAILRTHDAPPAAALPCGQKIPPMRLPIQRAMCSGRRLFAISRTAAPVQASQISVAPLVTAALQ
jgi:hypothetical protein